MRKITSLMLAVFLGFTSIYAVGPSGTSCTDRSKYVDSKNVSSTGGITLEGGSLEQAAQTYYYNGSGVLNSVRIHGTKPGPLFWTMQFLVKVYNVDANNRPTTLIAQRWMNWSAWDQYFGYDDVSFSPGVQINGNFAVAVELQSSYPLEQFQLQYTGDGEGNGEDLASLAGTSTGYNWTSAKDNYSKDGDFYIEPQIRSSFASNFVKGATCVSTGASVGFTNYTSIDTSGMFNKIKWAGYSGSNTIFQWKVNGSPVATTRDLNYTFSSPGVYTVSLTTTYERWSGSTCTHTYSEKVSVGLAVAATNLVNVTCYGTNTGSMTASGSGGSSPYIYSIGHGWQSSPNFNNLAAGSYTLYIMDALGCTSSKSFTITQPTELTFSTLNTTNSSCGGSDGGLLAGATGGTGALQYSIDGSNYQSSGSFTSLAAGSYTVYVKDANGCIKTTVAVVNNASGPQVTNVSYNNVSCNGSNDGTIIISSTGGSGTPQYSIDGTNWQASGTFTGLAGGTYPALVKDQAGCIDGRRVSISEPNALEVTAEADSVLCNGGNTGVVTVISSTGGTGTHKYSVDGVNYQSGTTFAGLTAGQYIVTVMDIAGCTDTTMVTVYEPAAITANASVANATCFGNNDGSITVTASGGTGSYMYSINSGSTWQPSNNFDGLVAGSYTITIKDENGCTITVNATITEPTQITASINMGQATCGMSNGNLGVTASGGSGSGYQYSIDFGSNWNSSGTFTGLSAGTYYIIVKDATPCYNTFSVTVTTTSGPVITKLTGSNITCNNGENGTVTVTSSPAAGVPGIKYNIDGGAYQYSNLFTGLGAGKHVVSVVDTTGCVDTASISLTEPNPIMITTTTVNVTCHGAATGSVTVNASGGTGTLAYSLDGTNFQSSNTFTGLTAGSYTVTVKDAGGCTNTGNFSITEPTEITAVSGILNVDCNGASTGAITVNASGGTGALQFSMDGINYQASGSFTGLTAGQYTVWVKDANGCVITINETITEPTAINMYANISDVSCAGGDDGVVDLNVSGGTPPYTYFWSNGSSTEDIFNLPAGSYTVTVTDYNGCVDMQTYVITQPTNPLIINANVTPASGPSNADGAIDATISGGTPPYTYLWTPGNQTTEDLTGLTPGLYTLKVTDFKGCELQLAFTVSWNVGVQDMTITADELKVYPNPTNHILNVKVEGNRTIESIRIVNIVGSVVYDNQPNEKSTQLSVDNMSSGVYFLQIVVDGQTITKRVEVAK